MSRIAAILRSVGLDTALVVSGTGLTAWSASYVHPALAILVVGLACLALGVAPHLLRARR